MLKLRELERKDLSIINSWRCDRELISCLGAPYRFIGPEIDEAWFDAYLQSRSNAERFVTVDDADDLPIALTTLAGIDWVERTAVLHIMVGMAENRSKGVGSFSLDGMLRHAFDDLNLRRIELEVLSTNERARGLYEKFGFKVEGTKVAAKYKDGKYVGMLGMAVFDESWRTSGGMFCKLSFGSLQLFLLWEILGRCFSRHIKYWADYEKHILKMCQHAETYGLVREGELAGVLAMYANDYEHKTAYITELAVMPQVQRAGVGASLLNFAKHRAAEAGMNSIRLEVRKDNQAALGLYKKCDFEYESETVDKFYLKATVGLDERVSLSMAGSPAI